MPRVSIIIPVYQAESTLGRCLGSLSSQTFRNFETIVVDSGPGDSCRRIVDTCLPEAIYLRHSGRLLPHEASNLAVRTSGGALLAFLDPDVYPSRDWLARLLAARQDRGGVLVGGVACYGNRWIDRGAHYCKFDKWLAGGRPRLLTDAASANMLIGRDLLEGVGLFRSGSMHADTDISWRLRAAGVTLWLEPAAIVYHHHLHTWKSLLRERYRRGGGYGALWITWVRPSRGRLAWTVAASVIPLRLLSQTARVYRNAKSAGEARQLLVTLPVVLSALYAWLLGETGHYLKALSGRG